MDAVSVQRCRTAMRWSMFIAIRSGGSTSRREIDVALGKALQRPSIIAEVALTCASAASTTCIAPSILLNYALIAFVTSALASNAM